MLLCVQLELCLRSQHQIMDVVHSCMNSTKQDSFVPKTLDFVSVHKQI
jgi:hypothetical protein